MSSASTAKKHDVAAYYDDVPYTSSSHANSQPPHAHTIARLFGFKAPDFRKARVLEIGCAGGGNLLPLALVYPDARFLGIDLSKKQIDEALQQKEAYGLKNIDFKQQDIMQFDIAAHKEGFDYIIAHGVFSWISEEIQNKVLEVCQKCLSPQGLAVISYNVLPGWNNVRSLREMIIQHTKNIPGYTDKVVNARFLVEFISSLVPQSNIAHDAFLKEMLPYFKTVNDAYILHEYIEDSNKQFYFSEFMAMARNHGLDYLGDANLGSMYYASMHPDAVNLLKELKAHVTDTVSHEQYMDYATNRRFRMTILCKAGQKINRDLKNEQILDYSLSLMEGLEVSNLNPAPGETITFLKADGGFVSDSDVSNALFLELYAREQMPIAAVDLISIVQQKTGLNSATPVRDILVEKGMNFVLHGFIKLHPDVPPHATVVSKKPIAFPLARSQALRPDWNIVTNVMGQMIKTSGAIEKHIIASLDGTKTHEQLLDVVSAIVQNSILDGSFKPTRDDGSPIADAKEMRQSLASLVEEVLQRLARQGILVG